MNRREFTLTTVGSSIAAISATTESGKDLKSSHFVHQVYFWLKNPKSEEDLEQLITGLKSLIKIKKIKGYHIGTPAGTPREVVDSSYSVSWLLFFKNAKDQDKYQIDPIHEAFVKNYKHLWSKVVVYDSIGK